MRQKRDFKTKIEYTTFCGKPTLLLKRFHLAKRTLPCPFCGYEHKHKIKDGHRSAHCDGFGNKQVTAPDGTILDQSRGYVLQTIYPEQLKQEQNEKNELILKAFFDKHIEEWVKIKRITRTEFKDLVLKEFKKAPSSYSINKALESYCHQKGVPVQKDCLISENNIKFRVIKFG